MREGGDEKKLAMKVKLRINHHRHNIIISL
jgi:hypothetical protein